MTKIRSLFRKTYNSLIDWIRQVVSKWTCSSGIHTKPAWVMDTNNRSVSMTYFGICRSCCKRITQFYTFSEGPLLKNIPVGPKTSKRVLEEIILACVQMFLKDGDGQDYITSNRSRGYWS